MHFEENLLWACFDGSEILSGGAFGVKFEQLAIAAIYYSTSGQKYKMEVTFKTRKRTTVGTDIAAKNSKWKMEKEERN